MKFKHAAVDIQHWAEQIRADFRAGRLYPPRAFILATRDPKMGLLLPRPSTIILMPENLPEEPSRRQRADYGAFIKAVAKKANALATAFLSEVWVASPRDTSPEAAAEFDEYRLRVGAGNAKDWPHRREAMLFTLEHGGRAPVLMSASITREGSTVTIAEFRELIADFSERLGIADAAGATTRSSGIFVGLMPEVN